MLDQFTGCAFTNSFCKKNTVSFKKSLGMLFFLQEYMFLEWPSPDVHIKVVSFHKQGRHPFC